MSDGALFAEYLRRALFPPLPQAGEGTGRAGGGKFRPPRERERDAFRSERAYRRARRGGRAGPLVLILIAPAKADRDAPTTLAFFGLLAVGLVALYLRLSYKDVIAHELSEAKWRTFGELVLSEKMDELIGKYGSELGFLRSRTVKF